MANKRIDVSKVKEGDILSETQYYHVVGKDNTHVHVKNERGFEFSISNDIVEEGMWSANQITPNITNGGHVKVNRTELIEILSRVGDTVFTAKFNKQPKAEDINEALTSINKGKFLNNTQIKEIVNNAFKGEERVIVARLISTETGFGRSQVIDLEVSPPIEGQPENRIRQIDHRSLEYIIYKGVKYSLK